MEQFKTKVGKEIFKNWDIRFYISEERNPQVENELISLETKCIRMKRKANVNFMFYRFLAMEEENYDAIIIRDLVRTF